MFRELIFWSIFAIALLIGIVAPFFYYLDEGASVAKALASLISSNLLSIAATLILVFAVLLKTNVLGAPRKY